MEPSVSGVGVLDKAVAVLEALELRPLSLAELAASTGLPRATAHRLALALEAHGLVRRDADGRFLLGLRLVGLGRSAEARFRWWEGAYPVLARLRDQTGEGVQLFVRERNRRLCVESLESPHGLRWIVPVGAVLPLDRGSAGRILSDPTAAMDVGEEAWTGDSPANRRAMWVESVEEREVGVASVSAPVVDGVRVIAAICVSGPLERLTRSPGARYGEQVVAAARDVERACGLRG